MQASNIALAILLWLLLAFCLRFACVLLALGRVLIALGRIWVALGRIG